MIPIRRIRVLLAVLIFRSCRQWKGAGLAASLLLVLSCPALEILAASYSQLLFAISCPTKPSHPYLSHNDDEACSVIRARSSTGERGDSQVERCHVGHNDMGSLIVVGQ